MFHLDLPQVCLSSFQASGGSFLRREAADRATKSREVDFSSRTIFIRRRTFLKVCFIRFPDFSKSILKHLQETCHYTNHVVFDILLFEVWISDETLWLVFNIWLTLDSNSTWFLLFPGSKKVVSTVQHDNVTIRSQENILVISKQSLQVVNFSTKW